MSETWRYLDWEYVCDQAPEVQKAYEDACFHAEHSLNWYGFINTFEGLSAMVQRWWDDLPLERRKELVAQRVSQLEETVDGLVRSEEYSP